MSDLPEPIVILGAPRSFTSLTSGIFRDHGVFFGIDRRGPEAPTGSCESIKLKATLKQYYNGYVEAGRVTGRIPRWKEIMTGILEDDGYKEGPWGAKHSAMFHPIWHEFAPKFICCRRDPGKILASNKRVGFKAGTEESIAAHIKVMENLVAADMAVEVWGEEYFSGDFEKLAAAFEYCGLEFREQTARNLINPEHFHVR